MPVLVAGFLETLVPAISGKLAVLAIALQVECMKLFSPLLRYTNFLVRLPRRRLRNCVVAAAAVVIKQRHFLYLNDIIEFISKQLKRKRFNSIDSCTVC